MVVWEKNLKCFVRSSLPLHNLKFGQFTSLSRTRTPKKCTKIQNARAGRAEVLFLLIDLFTDTAAILISIVSNSYYGMPRGHIHINLPPEHPIMSSETIEIKMAAVSAKRSIKPICSVAFSLPSSSSLRKLPNKGMT